ncbi:MAG: hypothetical protein K5839_05550 [Treponemataceae bacterium]|nr:hypothetical protein [Treponemataceae bacterium]
MIFILYNPLSNNKKGEQVVKDLESLFEGKDISAVDVLTIESSLDFCNNLKKNDELVLCGGDGTLNRFVNEVYDLKLSQKMYYYPAGSGNDFAHDVEEAEKYLEKLIPLNDYIKSLPTVTVNGGNKYFINGIGYGIDGYCCEVGDELRAKSGDKPVNYAGIAIKGLLGKFHPSNAKVTVDGVTKEYKSVWLAPSMIGKYYGGGMKVAPAQDRFNSEKTLSCVVWSGKSKLKTLMAFPSIFTGEHIKHTDMIEIRTGHEITVEFDRPQALQIDGETVKNVSSYSVSYK